MLIFWLQSAWTLPVHWARLATTSPMGDTRSGCCSRASGWWPALASRRVVPAASGPALEPVASSVAERIGWLRDLSTGRAELLNWGVGRPGVSAVSGILGWNVAPIWLHFTSLEGGGHGRRGSTALQHGSDGLKLNRRVRRVQGDTCVVGKSPKGARQLERSAQTAPQTPERR